MAIPFRISFAVAIVNRSVRRGRKRSRENTLVRAHCKPSCRDSFGRKQGEKLRKTPLLRGELISGHMRLKGLILGVLGMAVLNAGRAEIVTKSVEYMEGDTTFEGFVAYDNSVKNSRPGVLIVHQWKGLGDYEKMRAEMLAKMGYVAFACDIYGKGVRPTSMQEAGAQAGKCKRDRALLRRRVKAGLETLLKQQGVDAKRVAAIGYCFGGTTAL